MTEEKQAIVALANGIVKAMKSVQTTANITSNSTNAGTVPASKITGLPAVIASLFSSIESSAAQGDAVAQQLLNALDHIAAGEFETITADTAMIDKVYATFGDFITLVADNAQIGDLDVAEIRAGLADVGLLNIGTATITTAQIERASTGTLFVRDEVGGKVYIDDLAVSDANIVNLSAGTVLINDSNGDLVELYVDQQGGVSTRPVSYDGSDVINQNSMNGNRIIQNSITTDRLNASEIFATNSTVMNLIADDISATRLFANQGFIPELETTVIASTNIGSGLDLTGNASITLINDRIDMFVSNMGNPYIRSTMPAPVSANDAWFDPSTERHYVPTGTFIASFPNFAEGDDAVLRVDESDFYSFSLDANGYLLVDTDEVSSGWSIFQGGIYVDGLWREVNNIAFSNLKISVDGISSEVYDSATGASKIQQNANQIYAVVHGDTSVPYVQTSSVTIKDNSVDIASTGNVNIQASQFNIGFNTSGSSSSTNRVEISNDNGIKVTDQYGNYFQATNNKLGLYGYNNTPKIYMDSNGDAIFAGTITAGTITPTQLSNEVNNSISTAQSTANSANDSTHLVYKSAVSGTTTMDAPTSWVAIATNSQNTWTTVRPTYNSDYPVLFVATQSKTMGGTLSCTAPAIDNTTTVIDGGHITTGSIDASLITVGDMSATRIKGGTLTLGGSNNGNGTIVVKDANDTTIGTWNNSGIMLNKGTISGPSITVGGADNYNGTITVVDYSGNTLGTFNSSGINISRGEIITYSGNMKSRSILSAGVVKTEYYDEESGYWLDNITLSSISSSGLVFPFESLIRAEVAPLRIEATEGAYFNAEDRSTGDTYPPFGKVYAKQGQAGLIAGVFSSTGITLDDEDVFLYYRGNPANPNLVSASLGYNGFVVSGTKSRVVSTDQYSDRLLYCYETPSPMFGDIGEGVIGDDGLCYVALDAIFAQTITTTQYQVFLQKYGDGDCRVSQRSAGYFVVQGTPGLSFGWEIKAKQRDYDQKRLDRMDKPFVLHTTDYGVEAVQYIEELEKGRIIE